MCCECPCAVSALVFTPALYNGSRHCALPTRPPEPTGWVHLRLRLERVALRHVCPAVLPRLSRRGARDCCVHRQAAALVSPRRTLPHTCRRAAAQPSYTVTSAFLSGSLSPPPLPPPPLVTVSGGLSAHPGAPVSPSALPPAPSRRTSGTSASRARRTGRPPTSRRLAAVRAGALGHLSLNGLVAIQAPLQDEVECQIHD